MGDKNRANVFAAWISRQFPHCKTVLDVAGGNAELSLWLTLLDYRVTIIDKKARFGKHPLCFRKCRRKVKLLRRDIKGYWNPEIDLIVGMHPDSATEEIVVLADIYCKCFAVVPCCVMPVKKRTMTETQWIGYLALLPHNLDTRTTTLGISGKNTVVFGYPKRIKMKHADMISSMGQMSH